MCSINPTLASYLQMDPTFGLFILSELSTCDHVKLFNCYACNHQLLWNHVAFCTLVHTTPMGKLARIFFPRIGPWSSYSCSLCSTCHIPSIHLLDPKHFFFCGLGRFACDSCLLFMLVSETIAKSVTWHDTVMIIVHATIIRCVRIPCVGHGDVATIARFVMCRFTLLLLLSCREPSVAWDFTVSHM